MDRADNVQGPRESRGPNENDTIGLTALTGACPWGPDGLATRVPDGAVSMSSADGLATRVSLMVQCLCHQPMVW